MYEPFEVKIGKAKSVVPKWYQSSGIDQRVENLEQTMESLSTGQQELLNCMADMFEKLSTRMDNLANNTAREHGKSSRAPSQTVGGRQHSNTENGIGSSSSYVPRLVKLDFPRFNGGEDPTSWLCRAEQFFQFQETPEADRVSLASFHLEGDAQLCNLGPFKIIKHDSRNYLQKLGIFCKLDK
ncbi:hypothetical protein F0562_006469 [Nyssa sinensis]|uniref:Retrotransposon gag domain-containing protein n=1 Tax=Nyssa sinensis TaxID=561372 RepID=A0A5J5AND5_9ASTE|nr:hypothetical protein F0562_006469 [Nyssa sinensis]